VRAARMGFFSVKWLRIGKKTKTEEKTRSNRIAKDTTSQSSSQYAPLGLSLLPSKSARHLQEIC
jgi:hypothetical protein